jgi:hypothetical protein
MSIYGRAFPNDAEGLHNGRSHGSAVAANTSAASIKSASHAVLESAASRSSAGPTNVESMSKKDTDAAAHQAKQVRGTGAMA